VLARLKEAQKLGFKGAFLPTAGDFDANGVKLALSRVAHVKGLAEALGL
jgi:DNA repair protein RadA/Sms